MKQLRFYFDVVSPYAMLAFERLPAALVGISYGVEYRPVLLAGLLSHWGQKGPAEIEPQRAWIFRQLAWLAERHGIELARPAVHPFNPLALLRLLCATAPAGGSPNRFACETVLHHVWQGGADANDAQRRAALVQRLAPVRDPGSAELKVELRRATEDAIAHGVFGVPTFEVDGRLFFGADSLDMLAAYLRGDAWFAGPAWQAAAIAPPAVHR
jgi:2-hydroxychromene-2-carboxylate isomerase